MDSLVIGLVLNGEEKLTSSGFGVLRTAMKHAKYLLIEYCQMAMTPSSHKQFLRQWLFQLQKDNL